MEIQWNRYDCLKCSNTKHSGFKTFEISLICVFQKTLLQLEPHRQDLTEQQRVDRVDSSIYGGAK